MATKKAVGNLAIIISANTESLVKGFKKAGGAATKLKSALKGAAFGGGKGGGGGGKDGAAPRFGMLNKMTGGGGIMGLAGAAMPGLAAIQGVHAAIAKLSAEFTEQTARVQGLIDVSAKLGMTTEALNGMRYAAEQSGVPEATLDMALQRLTRRVAEAAVGTGEAQGIIKELGLDAKKLVGLAPDKQMMAIAEAMEKTNMSGHQLRVAFKLLDSEGAGLKELLAGGAQNMKKLIAEGKELNGTLASDDEMIKEFNTEATKMDKAMEGLWTEISVMMIPVLLDLTKHFKQSAVGAKNFFRWLTGRDAMPEIVGIHPKQKARIAERKALEDKQVKDAEEAAKRQKKAAEDIKKQGEDITKSMRTPIEKARDRFAELNRLFQAGAIDSRTYRRAIADNNKQLIDSAKKQAKPAEQMKPAIAAAARGTVAGFSAVTRGKEAQRAAMVQRKRLITEAQQRRRLLEQITRNTAPANQRAPQMAGVSP